MIIAPHTKSPQITAPQSDPFANYSAEEVALLETEYQRLLTSFKVAITSEDTKNIRRAFELAAAAHQGQYRKSGEPYMLHPIEVARICTEEIGLGATSVICALLHDVVEDTPIKNAEIRAQFGDSVALIVEGLTKLDAAYNEGSPQAENFRKVLTTLTQDVRVAFIKMADRMHNMRTLGSMRREKQLKIAAETSYIYAPLAHRLGLYNFKTEFQDLCLKITNREAYSEIAKKLNQTKRDREQYIATFIAPLEQRMREDLEGVKFRIFGRPKAIYSILNKINTKKIEFEEIYDLFAVRIVLEGVPQRKESQLCWSTYAIVTEVYKNVQERLKDWVSTPKSNGYQSLHTTVIGPQGRFVEVQIRTQRMDEIAERGFAAHWKYKGVGETDVFEKWLGRVRDMVENQHANEDSPDSIDFLSDFHATNLFAKEVYVYTPKGDLRMLPQGATALDFAFDIHTDIGIRSQAIKVNNRLVPMGYTLNHGDQIQVITNRNQKPAEGWLRMVVTGKAKGKIRQVLREEQRKHADLGQEILRRKLESKLSQEKQELEETVEMLAKYFGFKSRQAFYYAIYTETFDVQQLYKHFKVEKNKLLLIEETVVPPAVAADGTATATNKTSTTDKHGNNLQLYIDGQQGSQYTYQLATCCNPVPGDDVFAYSTANHQMKIHRTSCHNATSLMANYGYRIMKAEWGAQTNTAFVANLLLTGVDTGTGVIERLSHKISNHLGLDIRSFSIQGEQGYFEGRISLSVTNRAQLELVIRALSSLEEVSSVLREEEQHS